MKVVKYLILALILVSCNKESAFTEPDLRISVTTSTSKAMDKTSFDTGDVIDLYQWTNNNPNSLRGDFSYNGSTWVNSSDLLWNDVCTAHFFISLYPRTEMKSDSEQNGYIKYDISKDSSLLCARVLAPGRMATHGAIPLEFRYIASRLTVDLEFGSGFTTTPQVISLTLKSVGTLVEKLQLKSDIIAGELSNLKDILLYRVDLNDTFFTHIIPQKIGELELVLDYSGTKLMYHKRVSLNLESGSTYNIKFRIDR